MSIHISKEMQESFLATTALEDTWAVGVPLTFLGSWCLRHSRRESWIQRVELVIPYHWNDRSRIPIDLTRITGAYERILEELAHQLNSQHGTDYSVAFWRITLGWWLYEFAQVLFDRWRCLQQASEVCPTLSMIRRAPANAIPASRTSSEFFQEIETDTWNERLYADLVEASPTLGIKIQALEADDSQRVALSAVLKQVPSPRTGSFRSVVAESLTRLLGKSGSRYFLHADYLPPLSKLKLEALLGQPPRRIRVVSPELVEARADHRSWELPSSDGDDFEALLARQIPRYLPTVFLEGFSDNCDKAARLNWPSNPKVLLTAVAFAGDDLWKLYAAKRVEEGSRLILTQHGGGYGVSAWDAREDFELAIADRFLTWGWKRSDSPHAQPAPATKLVGVKRRLSRTQGSCVLVTMSAPRYSFRLSSFPIGPQLERYLGDQFRFTSALSPTVKSDLIVRLYSIDYGWDIEERWRDHEPEVTLDLGYSSLESVLLNARLFVGTYNATTFLETFSRDIPSVVFWDPTLWELRPEAVPRYEMLRSAGVLFDDPVECARHVNSIWEDVPKWWASSDVQRAVTEFRTQYAYVGPRPLRELKNALTSW
jgi:putative transferase (TIGR04331 family)